MILNPNAGYSDRSKPGFTLIETVVVIFIVSLIALIILAAVQNARERARRTACAMNLRQIGLAAHLYQSSFGCYPAGAPSTGYSWLVSLLPGLEQQVLFNQVNFSQRRATFLNTLQNTQLDIFLCPSDSNYPFLAPHTNYAGNFGRGALGYQLDGIFHYEKPITIAQVTDGLSNTSLASEWLVSTKPTAQGELLNRLIYQTGTDRSPAEFEAFVEDCRSLDLPKSLTAPMLIGMPWTHGHLAHSLYNHSGRIGENKCTNHGKFQEGSYPPNSQHPGGVNVLFCDGRLQFIRKTIALETWRAIASRAGGESIQADY